MQAKPYASIYHYFPERTKSAIRRTVEDLLAAGDIERMIDKGALKFKITSSGKVRIEKQITFNKFKEDRWVGKWQIIIFDIPEREKKLRGALREKLTTLGFKRWQESVYLSPFKITAEISEFIKTHDLAHYIIIFESKKISFLTNEEIARKIWDLETLNTAYREIIRLCGNLNSELNKKKIHQEKIIELWQKARETYHELLLIDSGLPKELLPNDWLGKEARELFLKTARVFSQKII